LNRLDRLSIQRKDNPFRDERFVLGLNAAKAFGCIDGYLNKAIRKHRLHVLSCEPKGDLNSFCANSHRRGAKAWVMRVEGLRTKDQSENDTNSDHWASKLTAPAAVGNHCRQSKPGLVMSIVATVEWCRRVREYFVVSNIVVRDTIEVI
jgi:hypothetical protein